MTAENGNGELRQLLGIKRVYRKDLASREEQLKAQFERDLAESRKRLKEKYLENVVDAVFAEPAPAPPRPEVAMSSAPAELEPSKCPECDNPVDPTGKFSASLLSRQACRDGYAFMVGDEPRLHRVAKGSQTGPRCPETGPPLEDMVMNHLAHILRDWDAFLVRLFRVDESSQSGTSFPESATSFEDVIMHHVAHVLRVERRTALGKMDNADCIVGWHFI